MGIFGYLVGKCSQEGSYFICTNFAVFTTASHCLTMIRSEENTACHRDGPFCTSLGVSKNDLSGSLLWSTGHGQCDWNGRAAVKRIPRPPRVRGVFCSDTDNAREVAFIRRAYIGTILETCQVARNARSRGVVAPENFCSHPEAGKREDCI